MAWFSPCSLLGSVQEIDWTDLGYTPILAYRDANDRFCYVFIVLGQGVAEQEIAFQIRRLLDALQLAGYDLRNLSALVELDRGPPELIVPRNPLSRVQ